MTPTTEEQVHRGSIVLALVALPFVSENGVCRPLQLLCCLCSSAWTQERPSCRLHWLGQRSWECTCLKRPHRIGEPTWQMGRAVGGEMHKLQVCLVATVTLCEWKCLGDGLQKEETQWKRDTICGGNQLVSTRFCRVSLPILWPLPAM